MSKFIMGGISDRDGIRIAPSDFHVDGQGVRFYELISISTDSVMIREIADGKIFQVLTLKIGDCFTPGELFHSESR